MSKVVGACPRPILAAGGMNRPTIDCGGKTDGSGGRPYFLQAGFFSSETREVQRHQDRYIKTGSPTVSPTVRPGSTAPVRYCARRPPTNFRGIELRNFPAEIARLALIIAEYQCDVLYRGQKEALRDFLPHRRPRLRPRRLLGFLRQVQGGDGMLAHRLLILLVQLWVPLFRPGADETTIPFRSKDDPPAGGQGRSHDGKLLLIGAVEIVGGKNDKLTLGPCVSRRSRISPGTPCMPSSERTPHPAASSKPMGSQPILPA